MESAAWNWQHEERLFSLKLTAIYNPPPLPRQWDRDYRHSPTQLHWNVPGKRGNLWQFLSWYSPRTVTQTPNPAQFTAQPLSLQLPAPWANLAQVWEGCGTTEWGEGWPPAVPQIVSPSPPPSALSSQCGCVDGHCRASLSCACPLSWVTPSPWVQFAASFPAEPSVNQKQKMLENLTASVIIQTGSINSILSPQMLRFSSIFCFRFQHPQYFAFIFI